MRLRLLLPEPRARRLLGIPRGRGGASVSTRGVHECHQLGAVWHHSARSRFERTVLSDGGSHHVFLSASVWSLRLGAILTLFVSRESAFLLANRIFDAQDVLFRMARVKCVDESLAKEHLVPSKAGVK